MAPVDGRESANESEFDLGNEDCTMKMYAR